MRLRVDDVPHSLKRSGPTESEDPAKLAQHEEERDVGESKHHDDDGDADVLVAAFMADRLCDHYEKRNKHVEYRHTKVYQ